MGGQRVEGTRAKQVRGGEGQDGPKAFPSPEKGIAHRFMQPRRSGGGGRDELVEPLLEPIAVGFEVGGEIHGQAQLSPGGPDWQMDCEARVAPENRLAMRVGSIFTSRHHTMPTYDYVCTKCGHELEVFQSMKDALLTKCPVCRKAGLKRKVGGGAGLIFKGTGFYITDYKKKSGEPSAPAKSPETKPETKPAATPATK